VGIGQRVKIVDNGSVAPEHRKYIGMETRISGPEGYDWKGPYWPIELLPDGARPSCLVPITDPREFESFMEKVMKPVKLDEPVSA